jgi:hypothetical protein
MHNMPVPISMWSCAVSTVVYLRNRTFRRAIGLSGGVPITRLTPTAPDASKFRVFGCIVFAKVPDKLRHLLGEKAFRGLMLGYLPYGQGYRVYNPIYTPHHHSRAFCFLKNVPGFGCSANINSMTTNASDADGDHGQMPLSHAINLDASEADHLPSLLDVDRQHRRLWSQPIRYGDLVANLSDLPHVFVTACCDHY